MSGKMKVGLIYGGKSGEHEVSLQTARAVISAFDFSKYELYPFYITREGQWKRGKQLKGPVEDLRLLQFADEHAEAGDETALVPLFQPERGSAERGLDVIFPLLHGTYGEDGTVQGLLEMMNLPYVGAGVLSSAVGMDKVFMKKIFAQEGLPQCLYRSFTRRQWEKDQAYFLMEVEISLGYPCFVKPAQSRFQRRHHQGDQPGRIDCGNPGSVPL